MILFTTWGGFLIDATEADDAALPVDLMFGKGRPVFATAPNSTLARSRLVAHLPRLIERGRQRRAALSDGSPR